MCLSISTGSNVVVVVLTILKSMSDHIIVWCYIVNMNAVMVCFPVDEIYDDIECWCFDSNQMSNI